MTGTVTYSNLTYSVDLAVDSRRRATGTITHGGDAVKIEDDGSSVYMQGGSYFKPLLKFPIFDRWFKYPAAPVANVALQLTDRAAIAKALEAAAGSKVKSQSSTASGVRTTAFASSTVTVQIPRSGAARPVEIDTAAAIQAGPDISQIAVHLSDYGVPLTVSVPAKYVDSADSNTWPPYFAYLSDPPFGYSNCDNNGCTWGAKFRNDGGKGEGTASVHFLVRNKGDASEVASCDAPLPPTASGDAVMVSCRISYDRSQGNYEGTFVIHNPTS